MMSRAAIFKAGLLAVLMMGAIWLAFLVGAPDIERLRAQVDAARAWGPALFFVFYVLLALLPVPKPLLTAAGAVLFGFWAGAGLALAAALAGASISFGIGRSLGREAVNRLIRGRLALVDAQLEQHGLTAVLVARLTPIVPFFAINYASGLSGVRFRHYVLGSAVGMVPGSLAYAALGAYGANPLGLAVAGSALIVLAVVGGWAARRLARRRTSPPPRVA